MPRVVVGLYDDDLASCSERHDTIAMQPLSLPLRALVTRSAVYDLLVVLTESGRMPYSLISASRSGWIKSLEVHGSQQRRLTGLV